jgi:Anti-sigma-K factor rskA/Putative zinc-finger
MNDQDIHSLSGAYAVDAVDEVERARFEAHLAACPTCQSEVRGLQGAAGELPAATLTSPPASLRTSVLAGISQVRPLPPFADQPVADSPVADSPVADQPASLDLARTRRVERHEQARRKPGRWLVGVAAAAAIVTGGIVWQPWSPGQEQGPPVLSATQQVLQAKDAQRFEGKVGTGTATVVRSSSLKKAVIVTANLPAAPKGKVYELWLQQGTAMVKAGFVPSRPSSTVLLQGDAATAAGTGITIEPAGGSPAPSLPPVALIAFA